ncbi:glycosyl hydrolase 53 family protein [Curvibacter sp. CHRR-16]|uniref:glycosyl hydrolase 53 family protein n=1 Tax=Curvibacter sp. CHRR-16 TaxID=2835872 RepID=UPI001BDABFAF|nr:glycosyl hydrolase 53 family protein [Curvibacter sp. CHRR-16]MBT0570873.1 glycosyl hydrolase 53 family protein [Curvibacter sp. CHRR-16]
MRQVKQWLGAGLLLGALLGAVQAQSPAITVEPVGNLRPDFVMGADVSILNEMEKKGARYYDQMGNRKDPLEILKDNGVNWIRLRLWHTPVYAESVIENGRTVGQKGQAVGGGNNDLATTIKLAKRAKALGLKFMLDIHYSDFWADPDKQTKPAAWAKLKGAVLEQAVYDYTKQVLLSLANEQVFPDMLQVGNELNGGLLWPDGKTFKSRPDEEIGGNAGFVGLLRQGIRATREVEKTVDTSKHTPIVIHLADGGKNELYRRVFDLLTAEKVDFDLIGMSFYPYWHGTIEDFQTNADEISARYGKDVIVMETAYAYTLDNGDNWPNLFNASMQKSVGYKATVQGQASLVRDMINAVAKVPGARGAGLFYWEPLWYGVNGVGWRTGEGNGWDNQAMFDAKGKALPSLAVFKRVRDVADSAQTPKVISQGPVELSAFVGELWSPPASIKVTFSDDAVRPVYIDWEDVPAKALQNTGTFQLKGEAVSMDLKVTANVTVVPRRNMVQDDSFESGNLKYWTVTGSVAAVSNERNPGNAHSGIQSLHYWSSDPFQFEVVHQFDNLKPGIYTLKAWAAGGGGEKALELFARDCGAAGRQSASWTNTGWQKWTQATVKDLKISDGKCTIGVLVDSKPGVWGNVDDFELIREE